MEQATDTPIIEATPATPATPAAAVMHPAAVALCEVLDCVEKDALHGDIRQATSTLAKQFAAYLRTPD